MKISKPVLRWVVGDCHELGIKTLLFSIKNIKKIYQNNFYYCICFNSINVSKTLKQCFEEVDLVINQNNFFQSLSYSPYVKKGPHWKLYPPRICKNQHEIIIDNDIVIYDKIQEIEDFLSQKNIFITTAAIKRSYSNQFGNIVSKNFNINSGLVGLPPLYDYKKEIEDVLIKGSGKWRHHFDEQTVVAAILQKNNSKIIPFKTISACCNITKFILGEKGTHFLGVNKGFDVWWKEFKIKQI